MWFVLDCGVGSLPGLNASCEKLFRMICSPETVFEYKCLTFENNVNVREFMVIIAPLLICWLDASFNLSGTRFLEQEISRMLF